MVFIPESWNWFFHESCVQLKIGKSLPALSGGKRTALPLVTALTAGRSLRTDNWVVFPGRPRVWSR